MTQLNSNSENKFKMPNFPMTETKTMFAVPVLTCHFDQREKSGCFVMSRPEDFSLRSK